jgi:2-keto-4-pentenoate hydratase
MPRRGWKVGINVPEVQKKAGLSHSGVGWLDGHRVFESGSMVSSAPDARLHVEPELAIHIGSPADPSAPAEEIRAGISGVSPALELVNYALSARDFDEIVECSMFHDGCVLGASRSLAELPKLGRDWPRLEVNGEPSPLPRADLVSADVVDVVRFVAAFLAEFGEGLAAGDVILSGSFCPVAVPLERGGLARADFGPLGEVRITRRA